MIISWKTQTNAESKRRCQMCMNGVESEVHFLTDCPLYQKFKYFGPNIQANIVDIMRCSDIYGFDLF